MDIQDWFAPSKDGERESGNENGKVYFRGEAHTPQDVESFAGALRKLARFARSQAPDPTTGPGSTVMALSYNDQLYYGGIAAGALASDQLGNLSTDTTFVERLSYFWLKVGTELGVKFPGATQEEADLFIRGAALRKPEERFAVRITIDSTDNAAFGDPDMDEASDEIRMLEINRLLTVTTKKIDRGETTEGTLRDVNGNTVGSFKTDLL